MNRLGFTGTQNTGKTSLVKALSLLPEFKDYYIATERSKYLRDLGIPLNTESTIEGQIIFLAERVSELLRGSLITDRTIWDVCAFTMAALNMRDSQRQSYIELAMSLAPSYDLVFYLDPADISIEDNGVRTIDPNFRKEIDENIRYLLGVYPPQRLIIIKGGTVEDRVKIVLEAVVKYL